MITSVEITKHELVPKHEILSEGEKQEVLDTYDATGSQLPKIHITDPVIELIGAKSGNVIRITRKSPTAGTAVYYRIVVEK